MANCGVSPQVKPTVVNVICGTTDITARKLAWSAWGKPVATAVGTAVVDLCAFSDCHTGSYQAVPIVVVASRIGRCGHRRCWRGHRRRRFCRSRRAGRGDGVRVSVHRRLVGGHPRRRGRGGGQRRERGGRR